MENLFLFLFFVSAICLIGGLLKPTIFSRFIKGDITRKKVAAIFGVATVVFFVLFGITIDTSKNNQVIQQSVMENTKTAVDNKNQNSDSVDVDKIPTPIKTKDKPVPIATSTPVQAKQAAKQNIPPILSETISQKNAIKKAKSYLSYSAFSYDGLIAQLEYEQFSHVDAVYGVDNSGANWNEQAAKKAKQYMAYSAFSRGSLIDQLKYEKFTQEQAEYGANAVGL